MVSNPSIRRGKKAFRSGAAIIILALLAAGCAVLTVDVDVYTGPLANTEDMQGQQAISLVMGAKPLLVQLRDSLEAPLTSSRGDLKARVAAFRTNSFYKAGEILVPIQGGLPQSTQSSNISYSFHSDYAARVNEILGLYEDALPPEVAGSVARELEIVDQYDHNHRVLRSLTPNDPTGRSLDPAITNQWADLYRVLTNGTHTGSNYSRLTNGYRQFWMPGPTNKFQEDVFPPDESTNGANWMFQKLTRFNATNDAQTLFGTNVNAMATFTNHVLSVSEAFFQARTDLSELLTLSLRIIADAEQTGAVEPTMPDRIRRADSKLVERLIDPKYLAAFFRTYDIYGKSQTVIANRMIVTGTNTVITEPMLERLRILMEQCDVEIHPNSILNTNFDDNTNDQQKVRQNLGNSLAADTSGMLARSLLVVNQLLAQDGHIRDRFGLATGPIGDIEDVLPITVRREIESFRRTVGGSLGGGRPGPGLETLINRFDGQEALERAPESWATNKVFQELLYSLSDFGQKVVTLANDAVFLQSLNYEGDLDQYAPTLQSVGNSILVQVNELKAQSEYRRLAHSNAGRLAKSFVEAGFTNSTLKAWATNAPGINTPGFTTGDVANEVLLLLRTEYIQAAHASTHEQAKPKSSGSATNATTSPKPKLANGTNFTLALWMLSDGTVTNALIVQSPREKEADPASRGSSVTISVRQDGKFEAAIGPADAKASEAKPGPGAITPTTNVFVVVQASSAGVVTNICARLSPDTNGTCCDAPQQTNVAIKVYVDSDGLITNAVHESNNVNPVKITNDSVLNIAVALQGGITTATNSEISTNRPNVGEAELMAAIQRATYFRSGVLYLRPTSSYLRSSYPASSINADQGIIWKNMLSQQLGRSIPFGGYFGAWSNKQKAKELSEIDRQSWQNINRVRVAGIGKVNYAVVKDDLGNWYVKGFDADPTNVFSSMIHLATYASGGAFGGTASSASSAIASKATGLASSNSSPPPGPVVSNNILNTEFLIATTTYLNSASNAFTILTNSPASISNSIYRRALDPQLFATNWSKEYLVVNTTFTNYSKRIASAGTNTSAALYEDGIAQLLNSFETCGKETIYDVLHQNAAPNADKLGSVTNAIAAIVSNLVMQTISARELDITRYRATLDLINSSAQDQNKTPP